VEEATMIRHKILLAFEAAERTQDPAERTAWLTFVIVGAGATGVELGGALGEIANHTLKNDFRSIRPQDARIFVLDNAPGALSTYPEDLSHKAERSLLKLGVRVRGGVMVTEIDPEGVTLNTKSGSERLPTRTVIWAAGVTVSDFGRQLTKRTGADTDKSGHIKVNPDLTIPNFPNIFVVGDLAFATKADGKPLPGVAQVAMQGGAYAAETIMKRAQGEQQSKAFHYFDKGELAVIGRATAVANIFGVHLSGFIAWLVWLFIHLLYIVQFQSRIVVLVQWGFEYLTFSRGALLITGSAATDIVAGKQQLKNRAEV
jgi:NADH dehydrogenase